MAAKLRPDAITEPRRHFFSTIAGHDLPKRYLSNAFVAGRLPHALLFHGPEGVGKTSTAFALAKLVNCHYESTETCACAACRKISDGVFADTLMIEPRGAAGQITLAGWKSGKDDPDNLQYYRFVDARPLEGRRKVLIFSQAERMNVSLANYLLKLIEEPPSYLLIVLLTHRRREILTTIRSRCTPVTFSPLTAGEMRDFAKGASSEPVNDMRLALAEGRPGALLNMLEEGQGEIEQEILAIMQQFQQYGFIALFGAAANLLAAAKSETSGDGRADFEGVLMSLQRLLRDCALVKTAEPQVGEQLLLQTAGVKELQEYASKASMSGLVEAFAATEQTQDYIPRQVDRGYVLEQLLTRIGRALKN